MGFAENDRIRAKNYKYNKAFSLYEDLKGMGYDNAYIIRYAEFALENPYSSRSEVYHTMISIVRSIDEKDKGNSST